MRTALFSQAIDSAVEEAMVRDPTIVLFGEDLPMLRSALATRFGRRVMGTPISESGFVGAGVGAAMGGLRPIVELYMVDFVAVCFDAVLNQLAKLERFSGGRWRAPLVLRMGCGGGYGDGGQHGQALWGMLGQIPGVSVVVPSTPEDGARLMAQALRHDGPVLFLEHKLLSESWLEFLGSGGRETVRFDVPPAGREGRLPETLHPLPFGQAAVRREGKDITAVSLGVGVHRALQAAETLGPEGISLEVLDLRTVRPLDRGAVAASVARTGRLLVVDEDYRDCALSGELAASALEAGLHFRYGRVCLEDTLPFERTREAAALPNAGRIAEAARRLVRGDSPAG
jgi:pyruvate/2-oxoglutarate/acetoin dehydrogenase E1 component